ncbi:MAG: glucans biosynthesis glucosyltransferase MdoH [Opitutaceae bacterium]|nr:glucans biosynthesis glucosyltransferase MdoH [Opitutaceae bacterium]
MKLAPFDPSGLDPREATRQRHRLIALIVLIAGPGVLVLADLHWRTGFNGWKAIHLLLFVILFLLITLGAAQALVGFLLRRRGDDPCRITASLTDDDRMQPVMARTAVVMPVCNEEVGRVIEALRVMYESVARTGKLPDCDFFLLSDSTDQNRWIEEEAAWLALTQRLGAQGRIFYRKRRVGINKKAGNLADFCRRWGSHYRYMVVLDADSIMTGEAIVRLAQLMERNPQVGIIQGVPALANGETLLARLQQFASRLYGPVSATGLNYWQLGEANYWGHNAIIRLAPFIRHCALPELPGDGPFGGRIMSHDYVEAALMRRAGWQVWLATELEGNYEECPGNLIELAQRDRRWLQGNLQHARLVGAKGFHAVNRVHFTLGILAYLASPLWLAFLAISVVLAWRYGMTGVATAPVSSFAGYLGWTTLTQAGCLTLFTLTILFLPKILAILDLRGRPQEIAAFGGWGDLIIGAFAETLVFTLLAPVLMLFHTQFIVLTIGRRKISWGVQRRGRDGAAVLAEAVAAHWVHTLIGLAGWMMVSRIAPGLAFWMAPILAGLIFSIPLSFFTGSLAVGLAVQREGLFKTPEESRPLPELAELAEALSARRRGPLPLPELAENYGLLQAVLDPYVNAVHVSLLRAKEELTPASEERFVGLRAMLLRDGPAALKPGDRLALLLDADSMNALHHSLWSSPAARLAPWWQLALRHYNLIGPAPETAFTRKSAASAS